MNVLDDEFFSVTFYSIEFLIYQIIYTFSNI